MNLKSLRKNWEHFGKTDPMWSIITNPDKKGNKWKKEEFFETGVREIDAVMKYIKPFEQANFRSKALDFGCGIGRLTQGLTRYFTEVHGVDIADSMIDLANEHNKFKQKCQYTLNTKNDLSIFPDNHFDFIYSNITLQHMEPRFMKKYLSEFARILKPKGLLVFQLPSEPKVSILKLNKFIPSILYLYRKLKYGINTPIMEMYYIHKDELIPFMQEHGASLVDAVAYQSAGPEWESFRYCFRK